MKTKQLLNVFLGLVLFSMPLAADETETENRISVGDRAMVHAEQVKLYEDRLAQMEDADEEDSQDEEIEAKKIVKKGFQQATYVTTHEGAFHFPIGVSFLGDTVELEDGSIWKVCSNDTYKTLNWLTSDMIIIVPNDSIFSSHDYKLINLNTGAKVKVNLYLGPIYNGAYTHWIVAIDYLYREIYLEDGSIWKMSSFDQSIVNKWLPNDTVIIGINDGLFSGTNPNILINVNMNNYSIGICLY